MAKMRPNVFEKLMSEAADKMAELQDQKAALASALQNTLTEYVNLVDRGDCGLWNAEEEEHVIAARAALQSEGK